MLEDILKQVQDGKLSVSEAQEHLAAFEELGFAKVDHHRKNVKDSLRLSMVKVKLPNKSLLLSSPYVRGIIRYSSLEFLRIRLKIF